jgi:hypothetical protein
MSRAEDFIKNINDGKELFDKTYNQTLLTIWSSSVTFDG